MPSASRSPVRKALHDLSAFAAAVRRRFEPVTVSVEVRSAPWRARRLATFAAATLETSHRVWDGAP